MKPTKFIMTFSVIPRARKRGLSIWKSFENDAEHGVANVYERHSTFCVTKPLIHYERHVNGFPTLARSIRQCWTFLWTNKKPQSNSWERGFLRALPPEYKTLARVAPTDASILFEGGSDTERYQAAATIHRLSLRASLPFIVINCNALMAKWNNTNSFRRQSDKFRDFWSDHREVFKRAAGGTLFLDEVDELPTDAQRRLLYALEQERLCPVGSDEYIPINTRIICSSRRNIRREIACGRFRADLYFRVAVVHIVIPAHRNGSQRAVHV